MDLAGAFSLGVLSVLSPLEKQGDESLDALIRRAITPDFLHQLKLFEADKAYPANKPLFPYLDIKAKDDKPALYSVGYGTLLGPTNKVTEFYQQYPKGWTESQATQSMSNKLARIFAFYAKNPERFPQFTNPNLPDTGRQSVMEATYNTGQGYPKAWNAFISRNQNNFLHELGRTVQGKPSERRNDMVRKYFGDVTKNWFTRPTR